MSMSQADLAREMTEKLGRSIDRAAVNKMVKGTRKISADEMFVMTNIFGTEPKSDTPLDDIGLVSVKVKAFVEAGAWMESWEWSEDDQYNVAVPANGDIAPAKLYAAETRGPSMNKRWPEGTVIVFTHMLETEEGFMPGKRYVVERTRADGAREHTVKLLHKDGTGRFWLVPESNDPLFQQPIAIDDGAAEGDQVRIVGRVRFAVSRE